jgi:hypothetical protein
MPAQFMGAPLPSHNAETAEFLPPLHCFILAGGGRNLFARTRRRRLAVGKNVKADGPQRSLQRVNNATIATRPTDCASKKSAADHKQNKRLMKGFPSTRK